VISTTAAVWSLTLALKGAVVLALVALAAAVLHRASAGLRHLVWSGGLAALLLLPFVPLVVPWTLPVLPPAPAPAALAPAPAEPAAEPSGHLAGGAERAAGRVASPSIGISAGTLAPWLLAAWGLGAALLLARLGIGAVLLRRVVRRATPLDSPDWTHPLMEAADRLELGRLPRLLASDRVAMPVVCGVFDPAIVVPAGAGEWSDRRRRAVLCHELAHLRRFDLVVNLLGRVACVLHWVNPLAWHAARQLRVESERACDDLVLGVGTRPSEYADHLLQIVCGARREHAPAVAIPMAQRREFEGRMLAILERDARREAPSRWHSFALAAAGVALLLPIAAVGPAPARPAAVHADHAGEEAFQAQIDARMGPRDKISPRVFAALVADLDAGVPARRFDAARTLGSLGAVDAADEVAALLTRDRDSTVREVAAWALARIGSRTATRPLLYAMGKDPSPAVRSMAVWALGQLTDPLALDALVHALGDASVEIRIRAAWAIGRIAPSRAPAALIGLLADPEPAVREQAAWALGQIADPATAGALAAVPEDQRSKARYEALYALARIGGEAARPHLNEALRHQSSESPLQEVITNALAGRPVAARPRPWPDPSHR